MLQRHNSCNNIHSGIRAVNRKASMFFQNPLIFLRWEDNMGENRRTVIHQTCALINFCVRTIARKQIQSFLCLPERLHQMGVHTTMIFCCQLTKTIDQRLAAGRGKTRRQNGFYLFAALMFCQILLRFLQGILCGLGKKFRRIAVHVHLSHIAIHSFLFHFIKEIVCGLTVNGCKNIGMEGTMAEHIIYKCVVAVFRILHILKTGFLRKCIMIQPVGKQTVHTDSALYILGSVHMKIGKSRNDQLIAVIYNLCALILLRNLFTDL